MRRVVLMGQQRLQPTVSQAIGALALSGRVALVTAGWQEYEDDDASLKEQIGPDVVNLLLHSRGEEVFGTDRELATAYRARQERLRRYQDIYRVRLEHAIEADRIISLRHDDPDILDEERRASIEAVRAIDRAHRNRCLDTHAEFEARWHPLEREVVAGHHARIAELMADCGALVIAGGHVAVLLNRLKLFGLGGLLGDRPVIAWSAGAMAISDKVVLFHDNPPHGAGIAEILDVGLGLCCGIVPFTNPGLRLVLDDRERVSMYARRFAPAACLVMDDGARIAFDGESWREATGVRRMRPDGELEAMEAPFVP